MAEPPKLQLMSPVTTTTKIPFDAIRLESRSQDTTEAPFQAQGTSDFLEVKSCSEFMSYVAPLNLVGGKNKLKLVLDTTARPTIFTIGEDDKLYFLVHAVDPAMGSELIDITPQFGHEDNVQNPKVTAFDVFDDQTTIYIAAALKTASDTIIYYAAFSHQDLLKPQKQGQSLQTILNKTLKWTSIKNNAGSKDVTSIVCGPPVLGASSQAAFQITVGVVGTDQREGFPFTVDPSPEATAPWVTASLPKSSTRILEMQPTANGLLILFEQSESQGPACTFRQFDPSTGEYLNDNRIRMEDMSQKPVSLGQPRTIQTDIIIGGSQGLGFYNWDDKTAPSEIILRDKSIKQVVVSELRVANQTIEIVSKLAIFAVTDQGDLHFIEGVRHSSGDVSLKTSGLPIRRAVHLLSTQYNSKRKLCELIYVTKVSNTVRHLHRDDQTSFWNDTAIVFQAAEKARKFPAYVTSLSFASQKGQPTPSGYEIELSGDPISVLIDDCSYFLDHRGLRVPVDDAGCLTLVIPAESGLDFPRVTLGLILDGKTVESIELDPASRVKKHIRSFENGADLQNARSSTGRPVFTNLSPEQAKEAANIVSSLPNMLDKVDGVEQGITPAKTDGKVAKAAPPAKSDAFSKVMHVVDEFIGDICEAIENATYVVFKAVFDVVGPVLELVLMIGGKAISIFVRTRRAVLKAAMQGFGTVLGVDASGLLSLLGLEDDSADVAKTQAILGHCMKILMTNIETFVSVNEKGLHEAVNDLRTMLQKYIPDKRPKTSDVQKENPLSWLLNNPVFTMIMKILGLGGRLTGAVVSGISRAWQDSMAKRFKVPDLSGIGSALKEAAAEIMSSGILQVYETVSEVFDLLQTAVNDPKAAGDLLLTFLGNSAWRIFDLLSDILFAIMALARKVLSVMFKATEETWHIPGLTPMWE